MLPATRDPALEAHSQPPAPDAAALAVSEKDAPAPQAALGGEQSAWGLRACGAPPLIRRNLSGRMLDASGSQVSRREMPHGIYDRGSCNRKQANAYTERDSAGAFLKCFKRNRISMPE